MRRSDTSTTSNTIPLSPVRGERSWGSIASSVPVGSECLQALRNSFNTVTTTDASVPIRPEFLEALLDIFNTLRSTLFL